MKHIRNVSLLALAFASFIAFAGPDKTSTPVPEPRVNFNTSMPNPRGEAKSRWTFANGASLAIDAFNGITYFPRPTGSLIRELSGMEPLLKGQVTNYPRLSSGPKVLLNHNYKFDFPSQIAYVEVQGVPYIITEDGKVERLPFDTDVLVDNKQPIPTTIRHVKAQEKDGSWTNYYLISMAYAREDIPEEANEMKERDDVAGSLNYGETFIVRQDGAYQRLDYRVHSRSFGNEFAFSDDGFLTTKNQPFQRAFDIRRWELEKLFLVRQVDPIFNSNGNATDPAAMIKSFSKNMNSQIGRDVKDLGLEYQSLSQENRDIFRRALAKEEMNSLAVLGPAGSGKTELVKAFIAEVMAGKIPDIPRSTLFLSIEASALGAGTKWVGTMESRIQAIIALSEMVPLVLVIDEIHALAGQGTHSQNSNDIFESLKPYLATGQIRIIGMSTKQEFDRAFSNNGALYQRFNQFHMVTPTREEVLTKFLGWTKKRRLPAPSQEVLQRVYDLSEEFNAIGAQPRKGILLLIEAYADLKINGRAGSAPTLQDLDTAARRLYNLDTRYFDRAGARKRLADLPAALDAKIVGQAPAKKILVDRATINLAGVHASNRPRMVTMLVGPKGTGKTDIGFAYANALGLPVKRIQLNQFNQYEGPTSLLREIKQALEINALTIFILDEADKAPQIVLDALLPILDNGRFVLPAHVNNNKWVEAAEVSALNAQFIITGNYATDFTKKGKNFGFTSQMTGAKVDPSDEALRKVVVSEGFSEYVLDRVDAIAHLDYLEKDDFRGVLKMHIAGILNDITSRQRIPMTQEDSEALLEGLTDEYYGEALSNRTALRLLNDELRLKIAQALMKNEARPAGISLRFNAETKSVDACETILGGS